MKKILSLIFVSLLLSGCDNFMDSSKITFEKCHNIKISSMKEGNVHETHSYEIDKEKNIVVSTKIWTDESMEQLGTNNRIRQFTHKLKSIGKRFISTDFPSQLFSVELVFDLDKKTIQQRTRLIKDIPENTQQCY